MPDGDDSSGPDEDAAGDHATDDSTAATIDGTDDADADPTVLLELPDTQRDAFKDPFGPVFTDVESLVAEFDGPYVTVGDIVTYHFQESDRRPALAFVDGRTKREAAPSDVRSALDRRPNRVGVTNPAGTITAELAAAVRDGLAADGPTTVVVDGEEDLAAVPAVLAAPLGATVVYGQPDAGMVAVAVTEDHRTEFRDLLAAFEGDREAVLETLGD